MGRRSDPRSGAGSNTGPAAPATNALEAALALQDLVVEHPRQALDEARELLGRTRIGPEAAAIAHRTRPDWNRASESVTRASASRSASPARDASRTAWRASRAASDG